MILWYGFIVAIVVIGISGAALILTAEQPGGRTAVVVAVLVAMIAAATITWQELALRHFAKEVAGDTAGMILRPVANGGGDHEFTPRGAFYQHWIFEVPLAAGLSTLGAVAAVGAGVLYFAGYRRRVVGLLLWAFATAAMVMIVAIERWFDLVDIFI